MPKGKKPSLQDVLDEVRTNNERIQRREVIVEEMRAQNRATIEAVETIRLTVEQRLDRFERETQGRFTMLEAAVRQNSADIRTNSDDIRQNSEDIRKNSEDIRKSTEEIRKNGEDIRALSTRVDVLGSLDRRVSVIERHVFPER
jgi:methyl-accepting chemotaxis protein